VEDLRDTLAFLNPRQFRVGHVLVIPKRHAPSLLELDPAESALVAQHAHRIARAIVGALDPSGINVFQNNGRTAGQTIPHYHVHLVPTYPGETPRVTASDDIERTPHAELMQLASRVIAHLPPVVDVDAR
jgi:histidine triad (HIT) family protein